MTGRLDRRLLRRAQRNLQPVLRDGEQVLAFDPATMGGPDLADREPESQLVTLYLTDLALYVLGEDGAAMRIARSDITVTADTNSERIDLELAGGGRLVAHPAPAPSRIARVLAPEE